MADIPDQLVKVMLEQLDRRIPLLANECPGVRDFWGALAALAEAIYEVADPSDHHLISGAISDILTRHEMPTPFMLFDD